MNFEHIKHFLDQHPIIIKVSITILIRIDQLALWFSAIPHRWISTQLATPGRTQPIRLLQFEDWLDCASLYHHDHVSVLNVCLARYRFLLSLRGLLYRMLILLKVQGGLGWVQLIHSGADCCLDLGVELKREFLFFLAYDAMRIFVLFFVLLVVAAALDQILCFDHIRHFLVERIRPIFNSKYLLMSLDFIFYLFNSRNKMYSTCSSSVHCRLLGPYSAIEAHSSILDDTNF